MHDYDLVLLIHSYANKLLPACNADFWNGIIGSGVYLRPNRYVFFVCEDANLTVVERLKDLGEFTTDGTTWCFDYEMRPHAQAYGD